MVIPGAQALLGFQFATFFQKPFDSLARSSQQVHLISLVLMAVSIILLMTIAAYHRPVYNQRIPKNSWDWLAKGCCKTQGPTP